MVKSGNKRALVWGLSWVLSGCGSAVAIEAPPTGSTGTAGSAGSAGDGGAGGVAESCDDERTIAAQQDLSHHIAADDTHVYWTTNGLEQNIERAPKCGGPVETLFEADVFAEAPGDIAVDGERVYWAGGLAGVGYGVQSVPKGGGAITQVTLAFDAVGALTIDADHVYFVSSCGASACVQRVPKGGGDVTTIAADQSDVVGLAVDVTHVYWASYPGYGLIYRAPKIGGGPVEQLSGLQEQPRSIAIDEQAVYVASVKDSVTVHVVKVPLTGAAEPTVLATGVHGSPGGIAVDGSYVYYAAATALSGPSAVFALSKAGGMPFDITGPQLSPLALTMDADAVYYSNNGWQGDIRRAPKP